MIRRPDGRIDVRGPTFRHLSAKAAASRNRQALTTPPVPPRHTRPLERPKSSRPVASPPSASPKPRFEPLVEYWRERTVLPGPAINAGLVCPTSSHMMALLGDPNSQRMKGLTATESVGPFRATGLKPALASLRSVLATVLRKYPTLNGILGYNGMHLIRKTRNGASYSNHSWGIAIDFVIGVDAPPYGAGYSMRGLDVMVPHFHRAGWYWGGGYRSIGRKDAMHFECGLALVRSFQL